MSFADVGHNDWLMSTEDEVPFPPSPPLSTLHTAPTQIYTAVLVRGSGVNEFYYVRQDHFLQLAGSTYLERLALAATYNAFGPHPIGAQVRGRLGHNYLFFPVCNYQLSWSHRRFTNLPYNGAAVEVDLACPS